MLSGEGKSDMGQTMPEQADWVRTGNIDPEQIDMPSFTAFRKALDSALNNVLAG